MLTDATNIMQTNMSVMHRDQFTDVNAVQHGVTEDLREVETRRRSPEERCAGLLEMTRDSVRSVSG